MPRGIKVFLWVVASWVALIAAFLALTLTASVLGVVGFLAIVFGAFLTYVLWMLVDGFVP